MASIPNDCWPAGSDLATVPVLPDSPGNSPQPELSPLRARAELKGTQINE